LFYQFTALATITQHVFKIEFNIIAQWFKANSYLPLVRNWKIERPIFCWEK